jgi:hypothetical protein
MRATDADFDCSDAWGGTCCLGLRLRPEGPDRRRDLQAAAKSWPFGAAAVGDRSPTVSVLKLDGATQMTFAKTAAIAAVMFAVGAPALAQQASGYKPVSPSFVTPQGGAGNMSQFAWENERRTAIARAHAGKVQWQRAVQVADLINSNRCKDAYLLAVDEKDEVLAKRVYEVCTANQSPLG